MSNEIIPQRTDVSAPRSPFSPIGAVPIVSVCSAGFVAACNLRVMGGDVTALDALEKVGALLEKAKSKTCTWCEGSGNLSDPFEEGVTEICANCKGVGKTTLIDHASGDMTLLFAQIKDLAADLRAALAETKGGHVEASERTDG